MSRGIYALRIVKPPRWVNEPTAGSNAAFFRPGLYIAAGSTVGYGGPLDAAQFFKTPLCAASKLATWESKHPGMELEIVEFREQAHEQLTGLGVAVSP